MKLDDIKKDVLRSDLKRLEGMVQNVGRSGNSEQDKRETAEMMEQLAKCAASHRDIYNLTEH